MKFIYYNQWKNDSIIELLALSIGYNYRAVGISITLLGFEFGFRLTKDFPKWDTDING